MSQIADDVLQNLDIVDVVSSYVQLKKVGRNFVGLSPFRNEKTPSFTVSPEKQIFKCFSTGIGGNAIKFIMEMEKIEFRDAIKILAPQARVDLSKYEYNKNDKSEVQASEKEKQKLMLRTAQSFFTDNLKSSSMASDYLKTRRHLSDAVIEKFALGYAPDSHYGLMQLLTGKGFTEDDITSISLGKKGQTGDIYSFYRNRITFPIYDHLGTLVGFGARAINPDDNPKYLNSSDSPLYDKSKILYGLNIAKNNIKNHDKLIVVEGYMDVIGLSRLGLDIGVATCGTSLTANHIKLIKRYTSNVYFLFDSDPAGFDATVRALKGVYEQDIYPKLLSLPEGCKDVDEWANMNPTEEQISSFIENSTDGMSRVVQVLLTKYDRSSDIEIKRIISAFIELLSYVKSPSLINLYIEQAAKKMSLNEDRLAKDFQTFLSRKERGIPQRSEEKIDQMRKKEEEADISFVSLFYDNFLKKSELLQSPKAQEMITFIGEISPLIGDTLIHQTIAGESIDTDLKDRLLEAQLSWERQRESLTADKQESYVSAMCQKYIQRTMQRLNKLPAISHEQKHLLGEKSRKILLGK